MRSMDRQVEAQQVEQQEERPAVLLVEHQAKHGPVQTDHKDRAPDRVQQLVVKQQILPCPLAHPAVECGVLRQGGQAEAGANEMEGLVPAQAQQLAQPELPDKREQPAAVATVGIIQQPIRLDLLPRNVRK